MNAIAAPSAAVLSSRAPRAAVAIGRAPTAATTAAGRSILPLVRTAAPAGPATEPDPNQPTLPGLDSGVLAHVAYYGDRQRKVDVHPDARNPLESPTFTAFDDAVTAAHDIALHDRHDARFGLFHHRQGPVDGIAVVDAEHGFRLVRTDLRVDDFEEQVPGAMWFGQYWTRSGPTSAVADSPATSAIVGAANWLDLRNGAVAAPTPFPAN